MSQAFDDLVDQLQALQDTSDNNQPTIDNLTNVLQPDGTIRAQLDFPLDPTSVQLIQQAVGTTSGSANAGSVVSNAAAAFFPSGWSVTHTGTGLYTVTHNLGTTSYAVAASPVVFGSRLVCIYSKTSVDFGVATASYTGTATDTDFDFIVST